LSTRTECGKQRNEEIAKVRNIAVIGAGMAGCTLARRLVDGGLMCMSSTRGEPPADAWRPGAVTGIQFDHGAQFVTATRELR
jgi:renalase